MEQHPDPHNAATIILAVFSLMFKQASEMSVESAYTWVFRGLSLVSLVLVIIINYPKAKQTIKRRKH